MKTTTMKTGIWARLRAYDHKMIGWLYLIMAIFAGVVGAAFSILLRLSLNGVSLPFLNGGSLPDQNLLSFINTAHALILVFYMVMPALVGGFANWLIPLMVGTSNMAFPRLNMLAFALMPVSLLATFAALFHMGSPILLSVYLLAAIYLGALSLILSFANFITTIITMRAPGLRLANLPVFVWSVLISSFLGLFCLPVMLAAVTKLVASGNVISSQLSMMLWFFSHPEIYVLLLPAFGIVSQIIVTFCKRQLFWQPIVVAAMVAMGFVGLVLWTQNLFTLKPQTGMDHYFFVALPLIGVPTAFILISWFATLLKSHILFRTPLLWAFGFFFTIAMGLVSAVQLVNAIQNLADFNSSAFVAHFHYILSLGAVFAIFAGWYFWLPKMSGYMTRPLTVQIHFWMMFVGVNAIFLPQHLNSLISHEIIDYAALSLLTTTGAVMAGASVLVFLYGVVETFIVRNVASTNPWGDGATTLEWQLPSPPKETWVKVPVILK